MVGVDDSPPAPLLVAVVSDVDTPVLAAEEAPPCPEVLDTDPDEAAFELDVVPDDEAVAPPDPPVVLGVDPPPQAATVMRTKVTKAVESSRLMILPFAGSPRENRRQAMLFELLRL
jgi:hypothetical protein